jgi:hypothetical protein
LSLFIVTSFWGLAAGSLVQGSPSRSGRWEGVVEPAEKTGFVRVLLAKLIDAGLNFGRAAWAEAQAPKILEQMDRLIVIAGSVGGDECVYLGSYFWLHAPPESPAGGGGKASSWRGAWCASCGWDAGADSEAVTPFLGFVPAFFVLAPSAGPAVADCSAAGAKAGSFGSREVVAAASSGWDAGADSEAVTPFLGFVPAFFVFAPSAGPAVAGCPAAGAEAGSSGSYMTSSSSSAAAEASRRSFISKLSFEAIWRSKADSWLVMFRQNWLAGRPFRQGALRQVLQPVEARKIFHQRLNRILGLERGGQHLVKLIISIFA